MHMQYCFLVVGEYGQDYYGSLWYCSSWIGDQWDVVDETLRDDQIGNLETPGSNGVD